MAAAGAIPAPLPPPTASPGRSEGDRLRFVGAATRRIARGIDLDEIVLGLCRATVPTFSDAILVFLRDPLPVGDERPAVPFVLRLRRTDRLRLVDEEEAEEPLEPLAAELCEVLPGAHSPKCSGAYARSSGTPPRPAPRCPSCWAPTGPCRTDTARSSPRCGAGAG